MRQETDDFDDGAKTVRSFDGDDRLCCVETFAASGELRVAIDYLYDDRGANIERIVRDATGMVQRRIRFDASGRELEVDHDDPVRWASMDGTQGGVDPKGQEKLGD